MSSETLPTRILIAFAPEERAFKDALVRHLLPLHATHPMDIWSIDQVLPGQDSEREFLTALDLAEVALLLLSADFLASRFLQLISTSAQRRRRVAGPLSVVPVLVRSCQWTMISWLGSLKALPADGVPIAKRVDDARDEAYASIASDLSALLAARRDERRAVAFDSTSRGAVRDPAFQLLGVLNRATTGAEVCAFFAENEAIAEMAFSVKGLETMAWRMPSGSDSFDLIIGEDLPTLDMSARRAILFGDPRMTVEAILDGVARAARVRGRPSSEPPDSPRLASLHARLEREAALLMGDMNVTVLVGRRNLLTPELLQTIKDVHTLEHAIRIRTYDSLVDTIASQGSLSK